jgi:hypothetical protein
MDVTLPLPFAITAAGYVEKYGPQERYNYLKLLRSVRCPLLVTLGALESQNNMAFRGAAEAIAELRRPNVDVQIVANADHFYTNAREELIEVLEGWISAVRIEK